MVRRIEQWKSNTLGGLIDLPTYKLRLVHTTSITSILVAFALLSAGCPAPVKKMPTIENDVNLMSKDFIVAAERGDTDHVRELLKRGVPINARDERGRTAILAATHGNKPETVKQLIEAGADINLQDNIKDNPFLYAGAEGLPEILKLLIQARADTKLTNRYGGTALIPAAEKGHVENVRMLLAETDVDVNHINNLGWTALLEAVILSKGGAKQQQIVQLLIEHGADVNIPDKERVTPLQHAKKRGFTEIEQMLVEAGAK